MKIGKGLLVLFITIILGSCFDPPEFPNVPEIGFDRIEFFRGDPFDSLVLYITFKDGDGDLGLSTQNISHISDPFHNIIYYQTNSNGELVPLSTTAGVTSQLDTLHVLEVPDPSQGNLVFPRTRKEPGYGFLPAYVSGSCHPYEYHQVPRLLVAEADSAVLDKEVVIVDTLRSSSSRYFLIQDTLYFSINPNHFNIEVDFLVKDPGSTDPDNPGYREYDWREELCTSFDGRFPVLSDSESALEGTLRYRMISLGFIDIFGINQTLKLRIQIKDRALNLSNVIYTNDFNLN